MNDESLRIQAEMQARHERFTQIANTLGWVDALDVQMLALAAQDPEAPGAMPEPMLAMLVSGTMQGPIIEGPTFVLFQMPMSMAAQLAEMLAQIDTSEAGLSDPMKWRPYQRPGSN